MSTATLVAPIHIPEGLQPYVEAEVTNKDLFHTVTLRVRVELGGYTPATFSFVRTGYDPKLPLLEAVTSLREGLFCAWTCMLAADRDRSSEKVRDILFDLGSRASDWRVELFRAEV